MKPVSLKADLHVHSKYSHRPSAWVLRKIGCSESYTEPLQLYAIAKQRGMDFVTISDHNTIDGALEIAHLPDTFISEEVTTYFPEDKCKLHVLTYNINEKQHEDITRLRKDVFELVAYLKKEKIVHALAHPFFAVNDRWSLQHFEQCLILFNIFEINGSRDEAENKKLIHLLGLLNPMDIERLANHYDLTPYGTKPWEKHLVAGSDDHCSLRIAKTYTEIHAVSSVEEFLSGISKKESLIRGSFACPRTFAHGLYSIAYQFYKSRYKLDHYFNEALLLKFIERALIPSHLNENAFIDCLRHLMDNGKPKNRVNSGAKALPDQIQKMARDVLLNDTPTYNFIKNSDPQPDWMQDIWFDFVDKVSEQVLRVFADDMLDKLSGANLFQVLQSMGSAASLYTLLSPYFFSYGLSMRDRRFSEMCLKGLKKKENFTNNKKYKVALFTDTFYEINGVAKTLQDQIQVARKTETPMMLITCSMKPTVPPVINFTPVGTYQLPEYPEMKLYYPPVLKMLDYCYGKNFTHIHAETPGPLGLTALAISQILKIPLYGTYHTSLPQVAKMLTGDAGIEKYMWKYVLWYYGHMDRIFVPSQATGAELESRGIAKEKIKVIQRGIDIVFFHPSKRNGCLSQRYYLNSKDLKLLYVGRISKEKNMALLVRVFRDIAAVRKNVCLIMVGDGPYLPEIKKELKHLPVVFTGYLGGEDLAQIYASSDIFLFPSTIDTMGNVVLEAQASGLPVIVTDKGGPKENIIDGNTGFVVSADNPDAFMAAIFQLIDDSALLTKMKHNARRYMEDRSFEASFLEFWNNYESFAATG